MTNESANILKASSRLLAPGIALLLVVGCNSPTGPGAPAAKVPVVTWATAQQRPIFETVALTGETIAVEQALISSTVDGPIAHCPWREGDKVEAGELLVRIDRELFRAEVAVAEADARIAEAKLADMQSGTRVEEIARAEFVLSNATQTLEFAQAEFARAQDLSKTGAVSQQELERYETMFKNAQSDEQEARSQLEMLRAGYTPTQLAVQQAVVEDAHAKLALARARLEETNIMAPFTGVVTGMHVRFGDLAMAKAPLLELADLESLVVRSSLPEQVAMAVQPGARATLSFDALPGRTFEGTVSRMFPGLHERMRTRTIEVKVVGEDLLPGMFARVVVEVRGAPDALSVPVEAIRASGERSFVHVLEGDTATLREVTLGISDGEHVQVLSGLVPGQEVVLKGLGGMKPSATVSRGTPPKAPGASRP